MIQKSEEDYNELINFWHSYWYSQMKYSLEVLDIEYNLIECEFNEDYEEAEGIIRAYKQIIQENLEQDE